MQNNLKTPISTNNLYIIFTKQIKSLQNIFIETLTQQKAQHYRTIKSLKKEIEEIHRNSPSPPLIPTSVNLQIPNRKNISKTDSLTPNSPTIAPPVKLTKYLLNPLAYSSKRSKLYFFLNQLQNKLNSNINRYPTPNS